MPHIDALLDRNAHFATGRAHEGLPVSPKRGVCVITCLDPRTDPAQLLELDLGDAAVLRNAGGRVTRAVIDDLVFIAHLSATKLAPGGPLFEVAVVHHTRCGTHVLADPGFRSDFAARSGLDEAALADEAVTDPEATVRTDVGRLRDATRLPPSLVVSGHVYDVDTGLIRTVVAPAPLREG